MLQVSPNYLTRASSSSIKAMKMWQQHQQQKRDISLRHCNNEMITIFSKLQEAYGVSLSWRANEAVHSF